MAQLEAVQVSGEQAVMSAVSRTEILDEPYCVSAKRGEAISQILAYLPVYFEPVAPVIADEAAMLIGRYGTRLKNLDAAYC